jgi:hypothetical protein
MSDAGEFVDATLQREGSWDRARDEKARIGGELRFYGASTGAVRGTIRDAGRRYPKLAHDDITALSSELWAAPVFERRLAAIVLLQSNLRLLDNGDLTRIEGFVRSARVRELVDPLAVEVIGPMIDGLDATARARADSALDRWAADPDHWLRRAAVLSPLRALKDGGGDWTGFTRRARAVLAESAATGEGRDSGGDGHIAGEAIALVIREIEKTRPELRFPPGRA